MKIRNYNDQQLAALALTGILTNVGLLRDIVEGSASEYVESLLVMIEDNISRLACSITTPEEGATGSRIVEHAKMIVEHCATTTNGGYNLHGMAKKALEDLKNELFKEEFRAEEQECKKAT